MNSKSLPICRLNKITSINLHTHSQGPKGRGEPWVIPNELGAGQVKKDWHHLKEIANDNDKINNKKKLGRKAPELESLFPDFPNSNKRNAYEKFSFHFHKKNRKQENRNRQRGKQVFCEFSGGWWGVEWNREKP